MAEYIDKGALLAHIKDVPTWGTDIFRGFAAEKYPNGKYEPDDVISSIENMPPADVVPVVRAVWIDKGWDGDWAWHIDGRGSCWRVIECSNCKNPICGGGKTKYCPHCGAKMENV